MLKTLLLAIALLFVPSLALAQYAGDSGAAGGAKPGSAHAKALARFKKADKDGDGSLTREEAKALPRVSKNFDAIDADHDGTVTEEEIHNYMTAKKKAAAAMPKQ